MKDGRRAADVKAVEVVRSVDEEKETVRLLEVLVDANGEGERKVQLFVGNVDAVRPQVGLEPVAVLIRRQNRVTEFGKFLSRNDSS